MNFIKKLILLTTVFLFSTCTVEELPPLEKWVKEPQVVNVGTITKMENSPKGAQTQWVYVTFETNYSSLNQVQRDTFEKIAIFRNGVVLNNNINLNSTQFLGQRDYELGKTYEIGIGLAGENGNASPAQTFSITIE